MTECESCGRWMPGRTDAHALAFHWDEHPECRDELPDQYTIVCAVVAEVTAAAERTADLALRLVRVTRERDEALAAVERVLHAPQRWLTDVDGRSFWALPNDDLRAALGERP